MVLRRKYNGAKHDTEAWDSERNGRGALYTRRSDSESGRGLYRSENAGISSENYVRIIMAESLRFPGEGLSAPGKPELR